MRSTKSKNKINQFPTEQGRAAEANATITNHLTSFFEGSSFDENETLLSDLLQAFICPDHEIDLPSNARIANTVFAVREINNLLRKLEGINSNLKGGAVC